MSGLAAPALAIASYVRSRDGAASSAEILEHFRLLMVCPSFAFKLEHEDGTPADPPSFKTAVPNWRPGDAIPLGQGRTLRVIDTRDDEEDAVLVVEPG